MSGWLLHESPPLFAFCNRFNCKNNQVFDFKAGNKGIVISADGIVKTADVKVERAEDIVTRADACVVSADGKMFCADAFVDSAVGFVDENRAFVEIRRSASILPARAKKIKICRKILAGKMSALRFVFAVKLNCYENNFVHSIFNTYDFGTNIRSDAAARNGRFANSRQMASRELFGLAL